MHWYYARGGQQLGPVEDGEFQNLVSSGVVSGQTLVWRAGMSDWQPYGELSPGPQVPATQPRGTTLDEGESSAFCSQCGKSARVDDMVQYEGSWVCFACKPAFFQRVREGVQPTGALAYAGFWIRFGAKLVDGIILGVVNLIVLVALMLVTGVFSSGSSSNLFLGVQLFANFLYLILGATYSTWFVGKYGATPGKMACKLKVVSPEGESVSYLRALGRYFAEMLSYVVLAIGYIMAGFDAEKRSLHDRICSTRVIVA